MEHPKRAAGLVLTVALVVLVAPSGAGADDRLFRAAGDGTEATGPYSGVATDAGLFGAQSDIAVELDGSFLLASYQDGSVVLRVGPKGRIRVVAGRRDRAGFSGDGGRATDAQLDIVNDIAVTPDRGFLITGNCRIRRVGPDGVITTVAGSGSPRDCNFVETPGGAPGDGGPATAATLSEPFGVAFEANGSFLISGGNRVRRVGPDGTITTVAGNGADTPSEPEYGRPATSTSLVGPHQVAAMPSGGFLVRDGYGKLHEVRPDGVIVAPSDDGVLSENGVVYTFGRNGRRLLGPLPSRSPVLAGDRGRYFRGWGDLALRFGSIAVEDAEPMPGGGLLINSEGPFSSQIVFTAPSAVNRLGVAIARETLPALLGRRLKFRLTRAARVELILRHGRRVVLRRTGSWKAGLSTVRLPRRTKRGLHVVRLVARASDGAVATDALRVLVGAWLPAGVARGGIIGEFFCSGECGGEQNRFRACRRFGPRRVDCVVGPRRVDCVIATEDLDTEDIDRCTGVASAVLRRSGYIYLRPYGCRRRKGTGYFQGRPRYSGRARLAPAP